MTTRFPHDHMVPAYMLPSLQRYVDDGVEPGGFLQALLEGDFYAIIRKADDNNIRALKGWAMVLYNDVPALCCGTPQCYKDWVARGGLNGKRAAQKDPRPAPEGSGDGQHERS